MRVFAGLFLAALLPLAAGCGSDGGVAGSASVVPGGALAYVSVDSDLDGEQWQAVEGLLARFPGGEGLLDEALSDLSSSAGDDLDFERDVAPALGPEVVFAVTEVDGEGRPHFVVLTQPEDPAALERLVERADGGAAMREVEGWYVIGEDENEIDLFADGLDGSRLSESDDFERAMADLDEGSLARAYMDLDGLQAQYEAVEGLGYGTGGLGVFDMGVPATAAGFALRAEDDGVRLDGTTIVDGSLEDTTFWSEPFEAELPETVPGDAIAYAGFSGLDGAISALRDVLAEADPEAEAQLGQLEGFLGVSLEGDIAPLFADEGALYVRPGALIPEITLVTRVEDEAAAVDTLDRLVAAGGTFLGLAAPTRSDVDGVEVRTVPVEEPFGISYGAFDGLLVVTTAPEGIRALRGDGDKLASSDAFNDALDRAGVPDETTGFAWVDLEKTISLVLGFVGLAGQDAEGVSEAGPYLEPLESLVIYGEGGGDTARFSLFLGVE